MNIITSSPDSLQRDVRFLLRYDHARSSLLKASKPDQSLLKLLTQYSHHIPVKLAPENRSGFCIRVVSTEEYLTI